LDFWFRAALEVVLALAGQLFCFCPELVISQQYLGSE
jgi:hypothetical protein